MSKKATYKLSTSIINSYLYYLNQKNDYTYISLVKTIIGAFETNKWLERGLAFEEEAFDGKQGKLSEIVKGLEYQVWANRVVEVDGFNLRLSAKVDAIDRDKKRIFDIKRVDRYDKDKYSETSTSQHTFYFYLFPEIEEFYYLVAAGPGDIIEEYKIVQIKRPTQELLEKRLGVYIRQFLGFLKDNNLLDLYTKAQKYIGR